MYKVSFLSFIGLAACIPLYLSAAEGYIGENPGLDFYSKIDEGSYTVHQKTVTRRLSETPTMDQFGKDCIKSELLSGMATTTDMLDSLTNMEYGKFNEELYKQNPGITLTTDTFSALTQCLTEKYKTVQERAKDETNARETISYLGLYMDGDTSNSDYDIIADIDKINMLIFSQKIDYMGTMNQAGRQFADFLARKPIPPLFVTNTSLTPASSTNTSASMTLSGANSPASPNTLLTSTCTTTGRMGPVDTMVDDTFLSELSSVLSSGNASIQNSGYSVLSNASGSTQKASTTTSANDFFHTMPCTSIFCIKVNMKPGSQNLLGGGKNVSIEGILDRHADILYPISESALRYEKMTMNNSESPIKNLRFVDVIAGLRVYMKEKPQMTRRDKREVTPKSEEEELRDIARCGDASAGLSTDEARGRSLLGGGYLTTAGRTSEDIAHTSAPLGPQEVAEALRYTDCREFHMEGSRKTYYDSFSTDLTEIQSYTDAMLSQIDRIMSTLTAMNNKPVH